jgi:hypothetical protein
MNKFDDREKSFEKKFANDQELQFKIAARSNKYLAEFVSSRLGKSEEEKKVYMQEIIKADMEEAGSEDVFKKIKNDFKLASIDIGDPEIRNEIEKAFLRAKEDFK